MSGARNSLLPFDPSETVDLISELDAWHRHRDAGRPLQRTWAGRLRGDLEAEAVAASTSLEGVAVTVDDVRRILAGDRPVRVAQTDQELVLGYRDAMQYVTRRADDTSFQWNRELVVGIHDRVLAGDWSAGAGRLRTGQTWIRRREDGQVIFTPPPAEAVAKLVDSICRAASDRKQHPALTAAWIHVALAAVHPFQDGNGRTARVLASLAMYRGGFRSRTFTSLEEWWGRHPADYYAAFECLGVEFDPRTDVTEFIRSHVAAQVSQIRALDLRERSTRGLWVAFENILADKRLAPRVANALWDAFFGMNVTAGYYRGLTDISAPTATSDLKSASAAGFLLPNGEGRGRRYAAGPDLMRSVAAELRVEVETGDEREARQKIVVELSERNAVETRPPGYQPPLISGSG